MKNLLDVKTEAEYFFWANQRLEKLKKDTTNVPQKPLRRIRKRWPRRRRGIHVQNFVNFSLQTRGRVSMKFEINSM